MPCSCCEWWAHSRVVQRGSSGYIRSCIAANKEIKSNSDPCKYFNPTYFHCDKFGQRITFMQCLNRRRNEKKLTSWQDCKKCRQFDKEIREVISDYFLDANPTVTPRHLIKKEETPSGSARKIKRRERPEETTRKIKRRSNEEKKQKEPKRTIERRDNNSNGSGRVIKRREKSNLTKALDVLLPQVKRKISRRKKG